MNHETLQKTLGPRPFQFFTTIPTTQDIARDWAAAGAPPGAIVLADEQTAGRGRQGRPWIAPPGSGLMFSLILRPTLPPDRVQRLTMLAGVAVAETLDPLLPGRVALKWPNDVLVAGRKIGGILCEAVWLGDQLDSVIMGIGINVSADFSGTELAEIATSIQAETGHPVDRLTLLADLLRRIDYWFTQEPALLPHWQRWLQTLGQTVIVYPKIDHSDPYTGLAEAVDEDGALWVRLETGERRRVVAADVGLRETGSFR